MTFDLAFWEGSRPDSDEEALHIFEALFPDDDDDVDVPEPPPDAIGSLIAELEQRWPPFDENPPWAVAPLGGEDARGSTLYINLV